MKVHSLNDSTLLKLSQLPDTDYELLWSPILDYSPLRNLATFLSHNNFYELGDSWTTLPII